MLSISAKRHILAPASLLALAQSLSMLISPPVFSQQHQYVVNGKAVTENVGKAMMLSNEARNLLMSNEPTEKALEILTRAEVLAPELPEVQSNLGMALARLGRTEEAITHVEKAVQLNDHLPAALMTLGSLYQSVGRTNDAIRIFKGFQVKFPTSEHLPKIKSLIAMLQSESQAHQKDSTTEGGEQDYLSSISYANSITKWALNRIPLKIFLAPTAGIVGYKPGYLEGVKQSFQDWSDATDNKVSFVYVTERDKCDIEFSFSNDIKAVSNPAEGGEAKVYPGPNGIVKASVVVLTLDPSPAQPMTPALMRWICLHEIGHSLGMMGHSSRPDDVMYSSMPLASIDRGLSNRDKNTLKHLYSDDIVVKPPAASAVTATDSTNPLTLNNEGASALNAGNLELALERLEKAHKIDPSVKVVKQNLAQAYSIKAMRTVQEGKVADADAWFKKSVLLLVDGGKTPVEASVLRTYALYLRLANRAPEALKIEAILKGAASPVIKK